MYTSFQVRNFRCLSELSLKRLKRVNLIAGLNGVGKTTLLEAVFLHSGGYSAELALRVNAFRGMQTIKLPTHPSVERIWDSLFTEFDTSKTVEIAGSIKGRGQRILRLRSLPAAVLRALEMMPRSAGDAESEQDRGTARGPKTVTVPLSSEAAQALELEYEENGNRGKHTVVLDHTGVRFEPVIPQPPSFQTIFVSDRLPASPQDFAERFGNLEVRGRQQVLVELLKLIEPRLRRVTMVMRTPGQPVLHGDVGLPRLMPVNLMGDGIMRLVHLGVSIGNAEGGVALLDEVENGLHHSVLEKVWLAVAEMAGEFNTQIFATTHSWECIVAAQRAFHGMKPYDFQYLRLQRVAEKLRAITYDRETLAAAAESGVEVR
ncbi:MAG: AAA family ATPase [bacterium]|nr:AAA family ATPase [bacterium]